MIKYEKLIGDVVKDCYKHEFKRYIREWLFATYDKGDDHRDCFILNGTALYLVVRPLNYIDVGKAFCDVTTCHAETLLEGAKESSEATITDKQRTSGKSTFVCVKAIEGDVEAWINKDYLKYFDLDVCSFRVTKSNGPVYIYESDKVQGLIMPIRFKD